MQPANPNLLPVSEADREAAWPFAPKRIKYNPNPGSEERWMAGHYDGSDLLQAFAAHRLAAEQSVRETWQAGTGAAIDTLASELAVRQQAMAAFVAMLEGMKREPWTRDQLSVAVIDEAIANAKAMGRAG